MGAIEAMRKMHAAAELHATAEREDESEVIDDWDPDLGWEDIPAGGLGRGYSTLTMRLDKVRTGEWGGTLRRRASDLQGRSL